MPSSGNVKVLSLHFEPHRTAEVVWEASSLDAHFRSELHVALVSNRKKRNRWLELIAAYKLLQAALLISVGVGALKLVHKDVADLLSSLVTALHRNPEGRLVRFLLDQAGLVD